MITNRGLVVVAFVLIIMKRVRRKPVAKLKGGFGAAARLRKVPLVFCGPNTGSFPFVVCGPNREIPVPPPAGFLCCISTVKIPSG